MKPDTTWPMPNNHWGCFLGGLAFSGIFALAGAALLYWGFVVPHRRIEQSQAWVETPCEIIESKVSEGYSGATGVSSGKGSYDYTLEISYRYEFGGREYVSHRYGPTDVGDTKEGWRRDVVEALPPGTRTVCYVNPDNPEDAAISREFHANRRMIIMPIALLLIGLLGIMCVLLASVPDKNANTSKTLDSA
jgi:hypothetical protein